MRVAYIGVGHHHTQGYLRPVLGMSEHQVVAVADREPDVAQRLADAVGCIAYGDYRELVQREKPDFVFALGPHAQMAAEAEFLIDEGIPFAMEKPMGISYQQVRAVADKATRTGAFAAPAFVMRFNGLSQLIRREMADDEVHYVLFRWYSGTTQRYEEIHTSNWLIDPELAGGGCLIHLGVHHIDWFRWLTGNQPITVRSAMISNRAEGRAVEDYSMLALESNGAIGLLETGYLRPQWGSVPILDEHYVIRSNNHHVIVHDGEHVEIVDLRTGAGRVVDATTTNSGPTPDFCKDVLERVARNQPPMADMNDMAEVMKVVDDGYRLAGPLATGRATPVAAG